MKQLFTAVLIILTISALPGCQKESNQINTNRQTEQGETAHEKSLMLAEPYHIASDGQMLIFKSVADYESAVNDPSETRIAKLLDAISQMDHTTYYEDLVSKPEGERDDKIEITYLLKLLIKI